MAAQDSGGCEINGCQQLAFTYIHTTHRQHHLPEGQLPASLHVICARILFCRTVRCLMDLVQKDLVLIHKRPQDRAVLSDVRDGIDQQLRRD